MTESYQYLVLQHLGDGRMDDGTTIPTLRDLPALFWAIIKVTPDDPFGTLVAACHDVHAAEYVTEALRGMEGV